MNISPILKLCHPFILRRLLNKLLKIPRKFQNLHIPIRHYITRLLDLFKLSPHFQLPTIKKAYNQKAKISSQEVHTFQQYADNYKTHDPHHDNIPRVRNPKRRIRREIGANLKC